MDARRVIVAGASGAGKTTLARRTGERIRDARRVHPALPTVEVRSRHDVDRLLTLLSA